MVKSAHLPHWMERTHGIVTYEDRILAGLRHASATGMTRSEISSSIFHHKVKSERINSALLSLLNSGLARFEREEETGGRPAERWYVIPSTAPKPREFAQEGQI